MLDQWERERKTLLLNWCISDEAGFVMHDWLGKPYHKGSTVAYPRAPANIMSMVMAKVSNISLVTRDHNISGKEWVAVSLSMAKEMESICSLEWRVVVHPTRESYGRTPPGRAVLSRVENITSLVF